MLDDSHGIIFILMMSFENCQSRRKKSCWPLKLSNRKEKKTKIRIIDGAARPIHALRMDEPIDNINDFSD